MADLDKSYDPKQFETARYQKWKSEGCFDSYDTNAPGQESFCIVIPPPNVTGALHMGHALTNTIQDILIRWRRMKGDNALWVPGTDHAGIATQTQVEKQIAKEGKGPTGKPLTRHDLGRDKFVERVWQWKEEHGSKITHQLMRLGSSLDWKRERFTMDEGLSKAVREVFVRLHEEGLIYRGERIINWCVRCQTALSDLEVEPNDRKGSIWSIRYDVIDPAPGHISEVVIATTRPETMLGDTAIAVHPDDERYAALKGKKVRLPLVGRELPVLFDAYVDREFGTGALKITPAHDFNDNDIGIKHGLPVLQVMGKDGKISDQGGAYAGLKFAEAREKIVADLTESGHLVKVESHSNKVGLCQRCSSVAEPMISKQWFVKIEPLAKPAIEAVKSGKIEFRPKSWEKTYFEWMYNIRDWCISRQLWWGHQIPAWYCGKCSEPTVARSTPKACAKCGDSSSLKQDDDVLDTWFSSGLWPFSTLGWPEQTAALKTFYPTSILETGFDIIFFWVARMIMMGLHFMGDVPFRKVYLHAMVRDEKGEKMSKSKGNVIDPLDLIDLHGADPLRFTLASMAGQGRDIKLSVDRVAGYRAFCNKLWNATKFFHLQLLPENGGPIEEPKEGAIKWLHHHYPELLPHNAWIVSRLQSVMTEVEAGFSEFELNRSAQAIYEFAWHEVCDWFIEFSKVSIKDGGEDRKQTLITLHYVLEAVFRIAHPIMPFVTEELWQSLPWKKPANTKGREKEGKPLLMTLMFKTFPSADLRLTNKDAERHIDGMKAIVEAIRNFRGENNISPKTMFKVYYTGRSPAAESFVRSVEHEVCALSKIEFQFVGEPREIQGLGDRVTLIPLSSPPVDLRISLEGLVDFAEETKRLEKEISKLEADHAHVSQKLSKETFIKNAPEVLVAKERAKMVEIEDKIRQLKTSLSRVSKEASSSK